MWPDIANALNQTCAKAPSLKTDSRTAKMMRNPFSMANQSILCREPLCARPRSKLSFPSLRGGKGGVNAVIERRYRRCPIVERIDCRWRIGDSDDSGDSGYC